MPETIVVLGAGSGGLAAAERLRANLPATDRVVLIDRSFSVGQGLSSLRVLRGWRTPDDVVTRLRPDALPGVSRVTGEVVGVDTDAKTVRYRHDGGQTQVGYDALVVALGAELDTAGVPGLDAAVAAGVAGEFYSPAGAAELHDRIAALNSGRIVVLVPAVPFKCPPAPYEAAFLIAEQLGARFADGAVRLDLITCEPGPVGVVGTDVGAGLVELLTTAGIGFHPEKTVTAIDSATRTLTFADGDTTAFDLLAAVPKHRSPVAELFPDAVNPGGWLPVDASTLATGLPGVWAVGDNTALPLAHGAPAPKAGFLAESAGRTAADQVARHLGYDAPDTRLDGVGGCIVEIGGGVAAKIDGDFLAAPQPAVSLLAPSSDFHAEKTELESTWLNRWG